MKVLHCAESIMGGVATYLRDLLPLQCEDFGSDELSVVVPASQAGELIVPDGVHIYTYSDHRGRIANSIRLAREVLARVRKLQPEIVHIHSTFAGITVRAILAVLSNKSRVIYCPHGWAFDRPLNFPVYTAVRLLEVLLANACEHIICISEHERRSATSAGIRADRLNVITNGVSKTRPLRAGKCPPWREECVRILFVGRLDHQKGIDILLDSLRMLGGKVHAIVAGERVLNDGGSYDVPDNATLTGWVSPGQLEQLFESADVLVVPSRWEGFGLVAAEALRAGLAVMATRVGGLPEIIEHEACGVLIEPESAQAIVREILARDREDWKRMGRNGPARVEKMFTIDRVHREISALYGIDR